MILSKGRKILVAVNTILLMKWGIKLGASYSTSKGSETLIADAVPEINKTIFTTAHDVV